VLVHKFVCRGTVEEKIDALIEGKQGMAREVLETGGEALLTELSDGRAAPRSSRSICVTALDAA